MALSANFDSSYGRQNFLSRKLRRIGFSAIAAVHNKCTAANEDEMGEEARDLGKWLVQGVTERPRKG
jgi:hypothetical protein